MVVWFTIIGTNLASSIGIYRYFNSKIDRIWQRFDEVKDRGNDTFVRKDMCKLMHEQTSVNLSGLEVRMSNRLDKLEGKFDQIIDLITKNNK